MRWKVPSFMFVAILAGILGMPVVHAQSLPRCDVDLNDDIDRRDITLITAAIAARSPVAGPDDPRDGNADGLLTLADATVCRARCTSGNCNSRPVANAGGDLVGTTGSPAGLDATASSDPDGQSISYSWTLASAPAGSTASLGNATTARPAFTPALAGRYVFRLVVSDGLLASTPDEVSLLVGSGNAAPTANAGDDLTVPLGRQVVLDGSRSVDAEGSPLQYSWVLSSRPPGSAATLLDSGTVAPRFTPDIAGQYVAYLSVFDGLTTSDPDGVVLTTSPGNSAPIANAGVDRSASVGLPVLLDGSASRDVDGNPLRYRWSFLSRPAGSAATLSNATIARPQFTADRGGQYVLQLIANDGQLDSEADVVVVTTSPGNSRPQANAGEDISGSRGPPIILNGADSRDPDLDPLAFSWSLTARPEGSTSTLLPASGNPPGSAVQFIADKAGIYVGQLIVADAALSDVDTVVVKVGSNQAPVADAGAPQALLLGQPIQLVGSGSTDVDGNRLYFRWSVVAQPSPTASVSFSSTSAADPVVTVNRAGTYRFRLLVADECGAGDPNPGLSPCNGEDEDFTEVVVDDPPRVSIDDVTVTEGNAGTTEALFTVTVTQGASGSTTRPITIAYATQGGTAQAGTDFEPRSGTIELPGDFSGTRTIAVPVIGDTIFEADESFTVTLTPTNALATDASGAGRILNDDSETTLTLSPANQTLLTWSSGAVTVSRGAPAPGALQVSVAAVDATLLSVQSPTIPADAASVAASITTQGTTGTTLLRATAAGVVEGQAQVTVAQRAVTLSCRDALLGVGRNDECTLRLANPAPAAGVTFTIQASGAGTVSPPSTGLSFAAGTTERQFTVQGATAGAVSLRAESATAGYGTSTVNLEVSGALISLGALPTIGPSENTSLVVSLSQPAGTGGVTITFASSDPAVARVTPDVFIPQGATLPAANPVVTGVFPGLAEIRADAPGFATDRRNVTVALSLAMEPTAISVSALRTSTVTLRLSAPAPAGLTVALASDNPAFAIPEPASVNVPAGALSVAFQVRGVAQGNTIIRASVPGIAQVLPVALPVSVGPAPRIFVCTSGSNGCSQTAPVVRVGEDLQRAMSVYFEVAPTTPTDVTMTVEQGGGALAVSASATTAGAGTATLTNVTTGVGSSVLYAQGLVQGQSARIRLTAPGYQAATIDVEVDPSGFVLSDRIGQLLGNPQTLNSSAANATLYVLPVRLTRGTLAVSEFQQGIRGGLTVPVTLDNNNSAAGTLTANPVVLGDGESSDTTQFDPVGAGTAVITMSVSGFDTPAAGSSYTYNVIAPRIYFCSSGSSGCGQATGTVRVGEDLQRPMSAYFEASPTAPTNVTVTVEQGGGALAVSSTPTTGGASAVTLLNVTAAAGNALFYAQGLVQGQPARIRLTAPGYQDATIDVEVDPSGFVLSDRVGQVLGSPQTINSSAANATLYVLPVRLARGTLVASEFQPVRALLGASVALSNSNPAAGTLPANLTVNGGDSAGTVPFDPVANGTAVITASASGFDTPATGTSYTYNVIAPRIYVCTSASSGCGQTAAAVRVGEDLQRAMSAYFEVAPGAPTNVAVAVEQVGPVVAVSTSATSGGAGTATLLNVTATAGNAPLYAQGLVQGQAARIRLTAPGYQDATIDVEVDPSGFVLSDRVGQVLGSPQTINSSAANATLYVLPVRLTRGTLAVSELQQGIRAGLAVPVTLSNGNSAAGTLTMNPVVLSGGESSDTTQFDPVGGGTAVITANASGFDTPATGTQYTYNVVAPRIYLCTAVTTGCTQSAPAVRVGEDLQRPMSVYFETAPTAATNVTVTVEQGNTALALSASPTATGSASLVLPNVTTSIGSAPLYVQGLVQGQSARIRLTAPGYQDATIDVEVDPSGFALSDRAGVVLGSPQTVNTMAANATLFVLPVRLTRGTLAVSEFQPVRAGLTVPVALGNSNSAAGSLTVNPVLLDAGESSDTTQFHPLGAGTAVITATASGFDTTATGTQYTYSVTAPRIYVNGSLTPGTERVGQNLQTLVTARLESAPATPVAITATLVSGSAAVVSASEIAAGSSTAVRPGVQNTTNVNFWIQGVAAGLQAATIEFSAPGYTPMRIDVVVDPSGFVFSTGDINTTSTAADSTLVLQAARLTPGTLAYAQTQEIAGGQTALVTLTNSNPAIGTLTSNPLTVQAVADNTVSEAARTRFDPAAGQSGQTIIGATAPPGFEQPPTGGTDRFVIINVAP